MDYFIVFLVFIQPIQKNEGILFASFSTSFSAHSDTTQKKNEPNPKGRWASYRLGYGKWQGGITDPRISNWGMAPGSAGLLGGKPSPSNTVRATLFYARRTVAILGLGASEGDQHCVQSKRCSEDGQEMLHLVPWFLFANSWYERL